MPRTITLQIEGGSLLVESERSEAPGEIATFLRTQGWWQGGNNMLWFRTGETTQYTWSQAMALEFYRFINLGKE